MNCSEDSLIEIKFGDFSGIIVFSIHLHELLSLST
jgi:hypothetical protein